MRRREFNGAKARIELINRVDKGIEVKGFDHELDTVRPNPQDGPLLTRSAEKEER